MEGRRVNFGSLNAKTTDHLPLVFVEMGRVYGNDWFVLPLEMPVDNVCEVLGLVVTDTVSVDGSQKNRRSSGLAFDQIDDVPPPA